MSNSPAVIAKQVNQAKLSAIKEMALLSAKVEGASSLAWGLPSFPTPENIRRSVTEQLDQDTDIGKYTLPDGISELRTLVAEKHFRDTKVKVDPATQVVISAGNMQALSTLMKVVLNPGDEIIVTDPGFASHYQQIKLNGGTPVPWPLQESKGWQLNPEILPGLISERTKAIVLVSPSNPTGTVFSKAALLRTAEIAVQHNILIFLDDPYSQFLYENHNTFFNLASEASIKEHLVYCFSFSKCHAMSGWRLGYMVMPEALKEQVIKVHDANVICAPRISQIAGVAALQQAAPHLEAFENILSKRRDLICQRLDALKHVFEYQRPDGAYYVFPKILVEAKDCWDFSLSLLHKAKVTVTPGSAFGPSGEMHVRMAYCVDEDTIDLSFDRMENYFGK